MNTLRFQNLYSDRTPAATSFVWPSTLAVEATPVGNMGLLKQMVPALYPALPSAAGIAL